MTDATVTFDLFNALKVPFDARRTKIWLTFNTDDGWIVDENGDIRMDAGTATITDAGLVTLADIPVPSGDTKPTDFQVKVHFDAPFVLPGVRGLQRKSGDFGWMTVTADADLTELIAEQYVPPTWMTEAIATLQGYVDQGADLLAAQILLSGIDDTDSAVAGLISNNALGPLTRAANRALVAGDIGTPASAIATALAAALAGDKINTHFTGDTKLERLGVGYLPLPSAHNPVYMQFVMDADTIDYPGGVGDNVAQQWNNIWTGDFTVRGTVTVVATGGTAAWTIGGQTANIAYNASAATVQTALRALSSVGAGAFGHSYIDVTGSAGGPYVVTYTPRFLTDSTWNAKKLTVDGTSLTGPSHSIGVTWENLGGADTGWMWGSNDYNVTSGSATGIGRITGRLSEVAHRVTGDIGYAVAGHDTVAWDGAAAGGTINRIVGRRIHVGYHLGGADPTAGKADEIYGLYINGITPSRAISDAVTTSGSPTVTSAAVGKFTAWDVNKVVTGAGIPTDTYIVSVTSGTSITLSKNCTASATITMTVAAAAQAQVAYPLYVEAGRTFLGGQVQIQPQSANETGLKVTAYSGVTSGTIQEWLDGASTSKGRVDALGYLAMKHDVIAREGDGSGRQVTIGGITLSTIAYASIQFGNTADTYMYRTGGGALAMGDAQSFRLGAFATAALTGAKATAVGAGALAYNYETNRANLAIGGAWATLAHVLSNTATLDFPSVAAGGAQELTITVTGAATGDSVQLGPPSGIEAGLIWNGYVSAANTVKVRVSNITASAIDPASATWKATVVR